MSRRESPRRRNSGSVYTLMILPRRLDPSMCAGCNFAVGGNREPGEIFIGAHFCFDPRKEFGGHGVESGAIGVSHGGEHGAAMGDDDGSLVSGGRAEREAVR
jgi:hypothetical protein